MLRLLLVAILATATDQKIKSRRKPYFENIADELSKDGGKWVLAAVGSNSNSPPHKSCVEVTISNTDTLNGCILVAHNHSIQKAKVIKVIGVNERNETDLESEGPIHQYMIKKDESKVNEELRNEVDWDAAVSSPMCWNPKTKKITSLRYIVTPIDETTEHLYLVAVSPRIPIPEYQVAILTKTKMRKRYVEKMIKMVNFRNFKHLESRVDIPGLFSRHGLPRVQMSCADGFDMNDPYDTINYEILNMQFDRDWPPFPDKEFKTILVKHQ